MTEVYRRLAKYLDSLPAGFPPAPDGVELRILQTLFTEEEAALALQLNLLGDEARVIAFKAGLPVERAASLLEEMHKKGLISGSHPTGQAATYSISQFVVGLYEDQVNHLSPELADLFEIYAPTFFQQGFWKKLPQIRTIPVMKTIPITSEVMAYEQAEMILRSKTRIAVRNCICRQERELLGKGCGKPLETCLSFDDSARGTVESGKGRYISLEEALVMLEQAKSAGLVLQPANSQNPIFLCACCSCCCGVLRQIKKEPNPGSLVANPFMAQHDAESCIACGACVESCPMEALTSDPVGTVNFNQARCIGCGLCVSACLVGAMQLIRKPVKDQPRTPKDTLRTYAGISLKRGAGHVTELTWNLIKAWFGRKQRLEK